VRRSIHVAYAVLQLCDGTYAFGKERRGQKTFDHRPFINFPGKSRADIDRLDWSGPKLMGEEDRAVEPTRQQHDCFSMHETPRAPAECVKTVNENRKLP
jgi:hypothetical protein